MIFEQKGGCKRGHYDVEMKGGWTQRSLLKGRIDKGGHYDVEMKEWI